MPLAQRKNYCLTAFVIAFLSLNYHGVAAWEPPKEESPDKTEGETSRGCPEYLPSLSLIGTGPTNPIKTSQLSPIILLQIDHLKHPQTLSVTLTSTDNRQVFFNSKKTVLSNGLVIFLLPKMLEGEKYAIRASIACQGSSLKGVRLSHQLWVLSTPEKTTYDRLIEVYQNSSNLANISPSE